MFNSNQQSADSDVRHQDTLQKGAINSSQSLEIQDLNGTEDSNLKKDNDIKRSVVDSEKNSSVQNLNSSSAEVVKNDNTLLSVKSTDEKLPHADDIDSDVQQVPVAKDMSQRSIQAPQKNDSESAPHIRADGYQQFRRAEGRLDGVIPQPLMFNRRKVDVAQDSAVVSEFCRSFFYA